MKTLSCAIIGAASIVASSEAGFRGFVAYAKQSGAYTFVDLFCAVDNASDKFLNIYNTASNGSFFQATGLANKTWKPDAANFNSTRDSIDSFMTAGTYSGAAYGGAYYASGNSNADPNFTGTSWNATPASAAAATIPALAGWYTGDPTSVDNKAIALATIATDFGGTRVNSGATASGNGGSATVGSANSLYGIWCSHLCFANTTVSAAMAGLQWDACASIKDGANGSTSQGHSWNLPAPSALALLTLSGVPARRRRA